MIIHMKIEQEFVGFGGFTIALKKNKDGVYKKRPLGFPDDWMNTKTKVKVVEGVEKNQTFLTGKVNNLTVLDFDLKSSYTAFTEKYEFLHDTLTVKTRKGFHVYLQYTPELASGTDKMTNYKSIDIINDNKLIFAPNTFYIDEHKQKVVYKVCKNLEIKRLCGEEVRMIVSEMKGNSSMNTMQNTHSLAVNGDEIEQIADLVSLEYIDSYDDYIRIVWAFSTEGLYDLSVKVCKKSAKFDLDHHDKIYSSNKSLLGVGTIYRYAKLSNKSAFLKIMNRNKPDDDITLDDEFDETDYKLASKYLEIKDNNILMHQEDIYIYGNPFWVKDNNKKLVMRDCRDILSAYIFSIEAKLNSSLNDANDDSKRKAILNELHRYHKIKKCINSVAKQKQIAEQILLLVDDSQIELNLLTPEIFCFKDTFFNIYTNQEVEIKKEDYISFHTGYEYVKPTEQQLTQIDSIIKQIMPDPEKLQCLLSILKSVLSGNNEPYFVLFNGVGSNGKGWFVEFIESLLGPDYFIRGNKSLITGKQNQRGANPDLCEINKKRGVFFSEPEEDEKLNTSAIKEHTDTPKVRARPLYKDFIDVYFCGLKVLECNGKPPMKGRADYAILRRVIDLYFESVFTNEKEDVDEENHVYLKKAEYKELGFIEEHRTALFHYILDNAPKKIYIPESVKLRSKEYVIGNDELLQWFDKEYEITNQKHDFVPVKDLYCSFKLSDIWNNLDKSEKRSTFNYKNFGENIKSNIKLRKLYKERVQYAVDGKKVNIKNVLVGVKLIEEEEEDDDDDDEGEIDTIF